MRSRLRSLWPLGLAVFLYIVNSAPIWRGMIDPPPGHVPMGMDRVVDVAQYATWVAAFQRDWIIPDYHAPWQTEAGFLNLFFLLLGRLVRVSGISVATALHVGHFIGYCLVAYALRSVLRVFCRSRAEAWAAFGLMALSVPMTAQAILPLAWWSAMWNRLPIWEFVEVGADGFFRGIIQSIPRTYGTAAQLFTMAWLGSYLKDGNRRRLSWAAAAAFLGSIVHPHEIMVLIPAGCVTLLLRHGRTWYEKLRDATILGGATAAAGVPYLVMSLLYPWIRDAVAVNKSSGSSPKLLLMMVGAPMILVLILYPLRWRMPTPTDLALQCWFWVMLVGFFLPAGLSHRQMFGRFYYVVALLLVRQVAQLPRLLAWCAAHRGPVAAVIVLWCASSVTAHATFRYLSWERGRQPRPPNMFTTVAPAGEVAVIEWMRKNASPDNLVLAPVANAPWFATVPMRSFASHPVFGITFNDQVEESSRFFGGEDSDADAARFLDEYGFRYVVAPANCPCARYLAGSVERSRFGGLAIHEFPGRSMKSYPASGTLNPRLRRRAR